MTLPPAENLILKELRRQAADRIPRTDMSIVRRLDRLARLLDN